MFSQMGLEIRIKWTSNYLDAQSLDDTLLQGRGRGDASSTTQTVISISGTQTDKQTKTQHLMRQAQNLALQ